MFASFQGKWGSYFGRSHEWYAPRSGVFRVEGSVQGRSQAQVFDGSSWWSEYEGRVERQSGPPAMFRWLFDRSRPLFAKPGLGTAAVDSLLGRRRSKLLVVRSRDGGRVIEGEFKLDGLAQGPARFRVRLVRRLALSEAKRRGLFAPPAGRFVRDLRVSRPGTPPQFGEPAYWFGPKLGRARAVATLDTWRGDHAPGTSAAGYTTVYRLPPSIASPVPISTHLPAYPGLGDKPPSDIWVECYPRRPGVAVPKGIGKHETAVIESGERVPLTIQGYTRGDDTGFQAVIVLEDAFCNANGLVSSAVFRSALDSFRPVR
jgi:hypothetical protein